MSQSEREVDPKDIYDLDDVKEVIAYVLSFVIECNSPSCYLTIIQIMY